MKIRSKLLETAEEVLGKRKLSANKPHSYKTPWYTPEVKEVTKEKKEAFLKYKSTRDPMDWHIYKQVRNKTNLLIRQLKEQFWESFTKDMEYDMYGAQRKVWKMLRNRKAEISDTVKINTINSSKWAEYFQELYGQQPLQNEEKREYANVNYADIQVTIDEVVNSLQTLKNSKAPGIDNISNEMLKYGGQRLQEELVALYNKIIKKGTVPNEWKTSITIPIFKKGSKSNPENYRGISLLNTTQKLLSKIMLKKIEPQLEISDTQQGFRRNRSTLDAIFIIRQIVEKAIEFNTPAFLCFVDLKKAFDRVRLGDVISCLNQKSIPLRIIKVIEDLNQDIKTKIQAGGQLTEEIPCSTGIRQGDSLSPVLFNVIMEEIIKSINNLPGYKMSKHQIRIVCYADDAVLIANSEDDLQRLLHQFVIAAKKYNMTVSAEKTKSMVISREPIRSKLVVEDKIIEQVSKFSYLGVEISSYPDLFQEVRRQTQKGARVAGYLRDITWKNKYLRTESKVKIYKTMVRPILTYAAETRAITKRTKQIMTTTEMNTLRAIVGKTRLDRVRNKDVRGECGIQDIIKLTKKRKEEWNNHVSRADDNRMLKIVRDEIPGGKRNPGRPPKRWAESWLTSSADTP